jgi:AmiR/NasT family two-component response regulator
VGVLMMKYGLSDDRAFEYLVRVSSHSNVKLRDVAAEVVAQANQANGQSASDSTVAQIHRPTD